MTAMPKALAALIASLLLAAASQAPLYRDASQPVDARVDDLLRRMTLQEKFWQLFMIPGSLDDPAHEYSNGVFGLQISVISGDDSVPARDAARTHADRINAIQRYFVERTRLGIPIIPFEEAVHGLAREGATTFPQAIALAATWDRDMMARASAAIAAETRSRGIRQVLSPVVNIADDVRWGRVEETYGEDPYLSAEMGLAFVQAFEKAGIVTTPKHFVANVGEGGRDSYPIDHSDRMLIERYFPPFEAAVRRGGARSIMTAYNSVDGVPATQNRRLITDRLKREWGFRGFVISDASATGGATVLHMTEPDTPTAAKHALEAGLDVIFQSSYPQFRPYWTAFERGMIAGDVIDEAVRRVLRAKFELGLFEDPYVDAAAAAKMNGSAAHLALAREASERSIVLLKNDGVLPLAAGVTSIAVIGADAVEARLGGYSGPGVEKVSILDGLRRRFSSANVAHVVGVPRVQREVVTVPTENLTSSADGKPAEGLRGEYFANPLLEGTPEIVRTDRRVDFGWTLNSPGRGIPFDWYSVRWTGTLLVPADPPRRFGVEGNDGYRLYLDGKLLIDNWRKQTVSRRLADVQLAPGSRHDIRLEYFETTGNARVKLVWDHGVVDNSEAQLAEAVDLARKSDVAFVVAGVEEGEFRDRSRLSLPGRQAELIEAVAATGRPVVVVLIGGSGITMPGWLDHVGAVLHAWYPGERGGEAVARVVSGDVNPAGRLPITFPVSEGQLPLHYNHKPTGRGDDYVDSTGHPLFPFGFGLSYTTFTYSKLSIEPAEIAPDGRAVVSCVVTNTGPRAGDEVAQLYVRDVLATVARPVLQLAGFERVHLTPGESRVVRFELGPEHLRMLDRDMKWVVEPGRFRVTIGASSKDMRLRGELVVRR